MLLLAVVGDRGACGRSAGGHVACDLARTCRSIAALVLLAAMAVGPIVTFGSRTLLQLRRVVVGPAHDLSNARPHDLAALLRGHRRASSSRRAASGTGGRCVACSLAVVAAGGRRLDDGALRARRSDRSDFAIRFRAASGRVAAPQYRQLVLIPSNLCTFDGFVDYSAFALLAGRHGLGINCRHHRALRRQEIAERIAASWERRCVDGMRSNGSLYVVRPDLLPELAPRLTDTANARCTIVDGYGVCFSAESYLRWRDGSTSSDPDLPPAGRVPALLRRVEQHLSHGRWAVRPVAPGQRGRARRRPGRAISRIAWRAAATATPNADVATTRRREDAGALSRRRRSPQGCRRPIRPWRSRARWTRVFAASRDQRRRSTHVDLEGESVWLGAYARERPGGGREQDARATVLGRHPGAAR